MRRLAASLTLLIAVALAPAVPAQDSAGLPVFDSAADMRAELDRLMNDRDFVALVSRFSPPALMSLGRVRVLEDRYKRTLAPFDSSDHLVLESLAENVTREVIAYWSKDTYAYVYLLSHLREDGVRILDFQISGDVRQIKDWW